MPRKLSLAVLLLLLAACGVSQAQTLQQLVHQPPDGAGIAFLLTDGTVIVQGNGGSDWAKLTPDKSGSYVNGTWKSIASLAAGYSPYAFASAVLADGRVIIEGGEYNNGEFAFTNLGAVYDPVKDTWTNQKPPKGWGFIGDSPSAVLPDGRFLLGSKFDKRVAVLDPKTLTWTDLTSAGKNDRNAEEGWTLMPDGSVLTYDVTKAPHSERYIPSDDKWVSAGSTIVDLHSPTDIHGCIPYGKHGCYYPPGEVGPGMLMPDGTVFATGSYSNGGSGPGHTAIYHPETGKWTVGPDFPNNDNAGDSLAVLLPNGKDLVLGVSGALYQWDGTNLTRDPVGGVQPILVLPTGQVLAEGFSVEVYNPKGKYQQSWAPVITKFPKDRYTGHQSLLVENEGIGVILQRRTRQVFGKAFVDDHDRRTRANLPSLGFVQIIDGRFVHQEYRIAVGLRAGLQAPGAGNRVVVIDHFRALFQHALAVTAAEHQAGFDDVGENEDSPGLLGDLLRERVRAVERSQGLVCVLIEIARCCSM